MAKVKNNTKQRALNVLMDFANINPESVNQRGLSEISKSFPGYRYMILTDNGRPDGKQEGFALVKKLPNGDLEYIRSQPKDEINVENFVDDAVEIFSSIPAGTAGAAAFAKLGFKLGLPAGPVASAVLTTLGAALGYGVHTGAFRAAQDYFRKNFFDVQTQEDEALGSGLTTAGITAVTPGVLKGVSKAWNSKAGDIVKQAGKSSKSFLNKMLYAKGGPVDVFETFYPSARPGSAQAFGKISGDAKKVEEIKKLAQDPFARAREIVKEALEGLKPNIGSAENLKDLIKKRFSLVEDFSNEKETADRSFKAFKELYKRIKEANEKKIKDKYLFDRDQLKLKGDLVPDALYDKAKKIKQKFADYSKNRLSELSQGISKHFDTAKGNIETAPILKAFAEARKQIYKNTGQTPSKRSDVLKKREDFIKLLENSFKIKNKKGKILETPKDVSKKFLYNVKQNINQFANPQVVHGAKPQEAWMTSVAKHLNSQIDEALKKGDSVYAKQAETLSNFRKFADEAEDLLGIKTEKGIEDGFKLLNLAKGSLDGGKLQELTQKLSNLAKLGDKGASLKKEVLDLQGLTFANLNKIGRDRGLLTQYQDDIAKINKEYDDKIFELQKRHEKDLIGINKREKAFKLKQQEDLAVTDKKLGGLTKDQKTIMDYFGNEQDAARGLLEKALKLSDKEKGATYRKELDDIFDNVITHQNKDRIRKKILELSDDLSASNVYNSKTLSAIEPKNYFRNIYYPIGMATALLNEGFYNPYALSGLAGYGLIGATVASKPSLKLAGAIKRSAPSLKKKAKSIKDVLPEEKLADVYLQSQFGPYREGYR